MAADTHPDHAATFSLVNEALYRAGSHARLLTVPDPRRAGRELAVAARATTRGGGSSASRARCRAGVAWPPPLRAGLTPEQARRKLAAIGREATQMALPEENDGAPLLREGRGAVLAGARSAGRGSRTVSRLPAVRKGAPGRCNVRLVAAPSPASTRSRVSWRVWLVLICAAVVAVGVAALGDWHNAFHVQKHTAVTTYPAAHVERLVLSVPRGGDIRVRNGSGIRVVRETSKRAGVQIHAQRTLAGGTLTIRDTCGGNGFLGSSSCSADYA